MSIMFKYFELPDYQELICGAHGIHACDECVRAALEEEAKAVWAEPKKDIFETFLNEELFRLNSWITFFDVEETRKSAKIAAYEDILEAYQAYRKGKVPKSAYRDASHSTS